MERHAKLYRARIYRKTGHPVRAADAYEIFARAYPIFPDDRFPVSGGYNNGDIKAFDREHV